MKIAAYITRKRKEKGLTQQQVADALHVSFQAVSKWENGISYPTLDILFALSRLLATTTDEILLGEEAEEIGLTYEKAGVDISYTDTIKDEMKAFLSSENPRVLSSIGQFASLYDISFEDISNPVLVLKAEEPGSKQKLAFKYGYTESICHDMVNHLVNDIIVMGAKPLAVLDTIICSVAQKDIIRSIIKGISDACLQNECELVGGETSVQPGVVDKGVYILSASIAGIVNRDSIIDGSKIRSSDKIIALASNGLHTNGYSLVRHLMEMIPTIQDEKIGEETFIEAIMKPHTPYYVVIKRLLEMCSSNNCLHGMAHITGGGIEGNLSRIIPSGLRATIDLESISVPQIFKLIRRYGNITENEMLRTFNCGVGFILIVDEEAEKEIKDSLSQLIHCYSIGEITKGTNPTEFMNSLRW